MDSDIGREKALLEAALFMAPRSLEFSHLKRLVQNAKESDVIHILNSLKTDYDERNSAVEIFVNLQDKVASMKVRGEYTQKVKDLAAEEDFHEGVKKTLALISFKQPIKQSKVIHYRNNKAYDHLKVLLEEGFIKRIPSGRTYILTTTKKFSEYFNVSKKPESVEEKSNSEEKTSDSNSEN